MPTQFFVGRKAAVYLTPLGFQLERQGIMTEWTLAIDGERVDISDYNSRTYKGTVGMRTATVSLRGPYPDNVDSFGYSSLPGDVIKVQLWLDGTMQTWPAFNLQVLIDKMDVTVDVKGVAMCSINAVVIGNFYDQDSTDTDTEPFLL
jgi:hypothetical protein